MTSLQCHRTPTKNLKISKIYQSLVFLLCNISTFGVFFKKRVQISQLIVKISDNIRKKLDESWTCPAFLQLNGRGENYLIFWYKLSNSYISIQLNPFKWVVYFTLKSGGSEHSFLSSKFHIVGRLTWWQPNEKNNAVDIMCAVQVDLVTLTDLCVKWLWSIRLFYNCTNTLNSTETGGTIGTKCFVIVPSWQFSS